MPALTFTPAGGGGGGPILGDANSIAYQNPTGTGIIDDPALTAAPVDQFTRPQIRDIRNNAGLGAVFRQGAWQADADPTSQKAEGLVIYGSNAPGVGPTPTNGGYARIKPDRLGLAEIIAGVNGGALFYYHRSDPTHWFVADDLNVMIAEVIRASGVAWFKELHIGSAAGPRILTGVGVPNGVVVGSPGDLYTNTAGGAGTTLWVKESGVGTNAGWVGK